MQKSRILCKSYENFIVNKKCQDIFFTLPYLNIYDKIKTTIYEERILFIIRGDLYE